MNEKLPLLSFASSYGIFPLTSNQCVTEGRPPTRVQLCQDRFCIDLLWRLPFFIRSFPVTIVFQRNTGKLVKNHRNGRLFFISTMY